jgi:hypothetical protein
MSLRGAERKQKVRRDPFGTNNLHDAPAPSERRTREHAAKALRTTIRIGAAVMPRGLRKNPAGPQAGGRSLHFRFHPAV